MLTINQIREKKEFIIDRLKVKNFEAVSIIDKILALDISRREIQTKTDLMQSEMNLLSKEIGSLMHKGKKTEAEAAKRKTYSLKEEIKILSDKLIPIDNDLKSEIIRLPNLPHSSVKQGFGADDNEIVKTGGIIPDISEKALPHWDLIKKYDIIDFDLGIKLTGAGFPVYKGKGAKLQRALISFFLDEGEKAGYMEILPPIVVNEDSGFGTGQLPDKEGQMYHATLDNFYLIPTAEVPVTNIYRDVILSADALPLKNIAYTPCFRREAGSYGKDTRGILRVHQFDKVEMVKFVRPEDSYDELEKLVANAEEVLQLLKIPYRVRLLCTGDLSFAAAKCYDIEAWSPGVKKYLEVSSCSNYEAFQARRIGIKFKPDPKSKPEYVHTLNGSGVALARTVAALLENFQTEKGTVIVPEVLRPYLGGLEEIS